MMKLAKTQFCQIAVSQMAIVGIIVDFIIEKIEN